MTHLAYVQPLYDEQAGPPDWERHEQPASSRHPRCIPLLTGTEDEASSAVLDIRYRPRPLIWTRTPPTEEGYWWMRPDGASEGMPVSVRWVGDSLRWTVNGRTWQPMTMAGLSWSSEPLPIPVEANA